MKRRSNVYIILIVFMLFIQQIISGCATTVKSILHMTLVSICEIRVFA